MRRQRIYLHLLEVFFFFREVFFAFFAFFAIFLAISLSPFKGENYRAVTNSRPYYFQKYFSLQ
ncbi:MAG: hypothetical protein CO034_01615 [Parcubacteria group bacterium CG_4_9_14_0_2_um_filter_35_11]|nr:MAG: hypothetical protein CO034_01615 [Parcubacteria group bacterium CG_4_9_14_0_2_um_filter_35_11]